MSVGLQSPISDSAGGGEDLEVARVEAREVACKVAKEFFVREDLLGRSSSGMAKVMP
jgi:hypothetical protein